MKTEPRASRPDVQILQKIILKRAHARTQIVSLLFNFSECIIYLEMACGEKWFFEQTGMMDECAFATVPLSTVITRPGGLCPCVLILHLGQRTDSRIAKWHIGGGEVVSSSSQSVSMFTSTDNMCGSSYEVADQSIAGWISLVTL